MDSLARILLTIGVLLAVIATVVRLLERLDLGRSPDNLVVGRGNFVYSPFELMLLLSLLLTLFLNLAARR